MAALIIQTQLGGTLRDNYEKVLSERDLNNIEEQMSFYDNPEEKV